MMSGFDPFSFSPLLTEMPTDWFQLLLQASCDLLVPVNFEENILLN